MLTLQRIFAAIMAGVVGGGSVSERASKQTEPDSAAQNSSGQIGGSAELISRSSVGLQISKLNREFI